MILETQRKPSSTRATPTCQPEERLAELELQIERGQSNYQQMGKALSEIRDQRLYRLAGYSRFDDYCRERWGWKSRQVAYNYIAATEVTERVQTSGHGTLSFSQAVELATLPATQWDEAFEMIEARGQALESMTVREVRGVVQEVIQAADKRDSSVASAVPATTVCVSGDLWILGEHRLLVGDSRISEDVARLMPASSASLIFTDPPYNVGYEGKTEDQLTIQGDRMSEQDYQQLLDQSFRSYRTIAHPEASLYVFHPAGRQHQFEDVLKNAGFKVRQQIVWVKNAPTLNWARYKHQHEPLLYCHVEGHTDRWFGDESQSTVWFEKKPAANRMHPTMKPPELVERALVNSSAPGDIVVDLFAGSGSTLIACQRHGRRARLMEIDEKYADVIVYRWIAETGKKPILDGDGRTFDEIARSRGLIAA